MAAQLHRPGNPDRSPRPWAVGSTFSPINGVPPTHGRLCTSREACRRLSALRRELPDDPRRADRASTSTRSSTRACSGPTRRCSSTRRSSPAGSIDELIDDGVLHDECRRIFRAASPTDDPVGRDHPAAQASGRRDPGGQHGRELRPDHRHRLGQVAGVHRPDRRLRPAQRRRATAGSRRSSSIR